MSATIYIACTIMMANTCLFKVGDDTYGKVVKLQIGPNYKDRIEHIAIQYNGYVFSGNNMDEIMNDIKEMDIKRGDIYLIAMISFDVGVRLKKYDVALGVGL